MFEKRKNERFKKIKDISTLTLAGLFETS